MTHPFEFGQTVHELAALSIPLTVIGFRYFGPAYVEVECTHWVDSELRVLHIPAWRLVAH